MIVEEEVWSLGLTQAQGSEAANKKLVLHPPEGLITICVQKRRGVNTPKAAHCNRSEGGMEKGKCDYTTEKVTARSWQEQISVNQPGKRAHVWRKIMLYSRWRSSKQGKGAGPSAAGRWEGAGKLHSCYEKAAVNIVQREGWREDRSAVPTENKLHPGDALQDISYQSAGKGGSVLYVKAKV